MEIKREEFLKALDIVKDYKEQIDQDLKRINGSDNEEINGNMSFEELGTSMRLYNILVNVRKNFPSEHRYCSIRQFNKLVTIEEFSNRADCGTVTLLEYIKLLTECDLKPNFN